MRLKSNPTLVSVVAAALTVKSTFASNTPWEYLDVPIVDAFPQDYIDQCIDYDFTFPQGLFNYFNSTFLAEREGKITSGVCVFAGWCGLENCSPVDESSNLADRWMAMRNPGSPEYLDLMRSTYVPNNPRFNIPDKTMYPEAVKDIISAVMFANEYNIELSIKNSGHSYQGAAQKRNTLLLNMVKFKKYSSTEITECSPDESTIIGGPCALTQARSKTAYVRVGGGENCADLYVSVRTFNEAQIDGLKYHVVGGAAMTVSPMGWTFQGGLGGSTGGRLHGFGVDQVIMIDMVLPIGVHVRFGPSEWEESSSNLYPRNTKISGQCHENPEEVDENLWVWNDCLREYHINFDDLWFAALGGGGGTYGIVTSIYLQLHAYVPVQKYRNGLEQLKSCGIDIVPATVQRMEYDIFENEGSNINFEVLMRAFWRFTLKFYLAPNDIGVTTEESNACTSYSHRVFGDGGACYGEGAGDVYGAAWKRYITSQNKSLAESGMSYSDILLAHDCMDGTIVNIEDAIDIAGNYLPVQPDPIEVAKLEAQYPQARSGAKSVLPDIGAGDQISFNALIPEKWIIDNQEKAVSMLLSANTHTYFAHGGGGSVAQEENSVALSPAHRTAGFMMFFIYSYPNGFFSDLFPQMYDTSSHNFPGFIGSNHASPYVRGPLKDDWSKPCPNEWAEAKRDEECISFQTSIYGTELRVRLESIKKNIDPSLILNCNYCIGNDNREGNNIMDAVGKSNKAKKSEKGQNSGKSGKTGDKVSKASTTSKKKSGKSGKNGEKVSKASATTKKKK